MHARSVALAASIILAACNHEAFAAHQAALQRQPQLGRSLVQLLVPAIASNAVSLALPPERRPHQYCSWPVAVSLAGALSADALAAARAEALEAPGAADSCARLLQAAARLVQLAPFSEDSGSEEVRGMVQMLELLGCAARSQRLSQQRRQAAGTAASVQQLLVQRQQALPLLQLAPKLAAVLHANTQPRNLVAMGASPGLAIAQVLHLLYSVGDPAGATGARVVIGALEAGAVNGATAKSCAARLTEWCAAAAGSLALVPALAQLVLAARLQGESAAAVARGANSMAVMAMGLADGAAEDGSVLPTLARSDAAQLEAASAAAWQLHSSACRLVHWVAAGGAQPLAAVPANLRGVMAGLTRLVEAACTLHVEQGEPEAGVRCAPGRSGVAKAAAAWLGLCGRLNRAHGLDARKLLSPPLLLLPRVGASKHLRPRTWRRCGALLRWRVLNQVKPAASSWQQ